MLKSTKNYLKVSVPCIKNNCKAVHSNTYVKSHVFYILWLNLSRFSVRITLIGHWHINQL